jgi:hypothetical protein
MRGTMKRFEKRTSTFSRRGGSQFVKEFIAFFPSMAVTLLPSSNEGFMGLREKHPAYNKLLILFFNEDPF